MIPKKPILVIFQAIDTPLDSLSAFFVKATSDILTFFALFFGISGLLYRSGSEEYFSNISNNKEQLSTELAKSKKSQFE